MSKASTLSQTVPPADAQQEVKRINISRVESARDTVTSDCTAAEIIDQIRIGSGGVGARIERIREKFWRVMGTTNGDREAAKDAVNELKKTLPGVTWSGTFKHRKDEALNQPSGLLGADLDGLGPAGIAEAREALRKSEFVWAIFVSPTGDGLKVVIRVRADRDTHLASFRAVEELIFQLTGRRIDTKCSNLSRLCFLSYDPEAYLNEDAIELPPLPEAEPRKSSDSSPVSDELLQIRRTIASELLGDIAWNSLSSGYCACPGQDSHTSGDGDRDCQVYLDGVPTITCFHESCLEIVEHRNYELRSRIGKQERLLSEASREIQLPEIVCANEFLNEKLEMPAELVSGLIHRNTLTMLAGGSKCAKTFALLDLGVSVSEGMPWWNREVVQGRVLYVNFETAPPFLQKRLFALADAKDITRPLANFDVWNLRGYAADVEILMPKIIERCRSENYAMIILDPIYKLMGGTNENAAGEMADFLNAFEKLARETGAAVVYAHHFAKGLAASKDQLDRASGSGVFARHADGIITMTPHEEENAFVVEATLRNLPAPQPFVMRWGYPLMQPANHLDPKRLKNKPGRKTKYLVADVIDSLQDGMTAGQWQKAAYETYGMKKTTFNDLKAAALREDRVKQKDGMWFHIAKVRVVNPMTGTNVLRDATPLDLAGRERAA